MIPDLKAYLAYVLARVEAESIEVQPEGGALGQRPRRATSCGRRATAWVRTGARCC